MIWEMLYFFRIDFTKIFLAGPSLQLSYDFLPFLKILPEPILDGIVFILLICSVLIVLGKFYKVAITTFFLGFTYIFLLDKAYYNNHLYLVCLLSFLLIFIPANRKLSLAKKGAPKQNPFRYWHILVLRLQIALVYFFGGIAKLNADWLFNQEPARTIMEQKASESILGSLLTTEAMVYFITYGGLLFDLAIGFLLFIPKTRKLALWAAVGFNVMNAWIFNDINIFPYMMICALVLFMDPNIVAEFFGKKTKTKKELKNEEPLARVPKYIITGIVVYFVIQAALPFRHLLYAGNTEWTGYGQRFAWRMKIQNRNTKTIEFKVFDVDNKIIYPVDFKSYNLNRDQITKLSQDPRAAVQFAKFLKQHCVENKGMKNVEVKALIDVSLNGRPSQPIFSTAQDLAALKNDTEIKKAILPLKK